MCPVKVTSENRKNGQSPMRRDVIAAGAARVHFDDPRSTRITGAVLGVEARTVRRWRSDGFGSPQDRYDRYLLNHPSPYRLVSHVKALAKQEAIKKLSDPELIARYHELLPLDKTLDSEDTNLDLARGIPWVARAQMKERDGCINEELAAICYEFAVRGITEEEVLG